jgi:hypothetical protein
MCLTVDECFDTREEAIKRADNPHIAKEDIYVYKIFKAIPRRARKIYGGHLWSPYRQFLYELNGTYRTSLQPTAIRVVDSVVSRTWWSGYCLIINQGLHAFTTAKDADKRGLGIIVKCKIPSGSKYFIGLDNEIVSDTLVIGSWFNYIIGKILS